MATNRVQPGQVIDWINGTGSAVVSGQVVAIGNRVGVALGDIADGAAGQVAVEEVFSLPKANVAIGAGVQVYWDAAGNPVGGAAGSGAIVLTASGNTAAGYAIAAAADVDANVNVKLNG